MPNRLSQEKSPYLQQHKNNPVDWYPWGDEAFERAKELNKPVFLSIGYATCHWCHVMEHESFEDESIAALMNESFINVKVDREERPDIDSMYMTVCQMLNGHGGWPLTIVMTPEKEPFFAATYVPKEARFNRIGLRQLIPGINGMWTHEPGKIRKAIEKIREGYQRALEFETGTVPDSNTAHVASELLMQRFDPDHGGFGSAPKFPSPHNLMFLLREWKYTGDPRLLEAVHMTLRKMRLGGIWDHVGGGFHRYSTDREWLLPHFEKMLYDQALLIMAYTEAWLAKKDPLLRQTLLDTVSYVFSELRSSDGAFYSAEDADSEGEEGTFYVWTKKELSTLLSDDDLKWVCSHFNISGSGNFKDEATGKTTGKNILHLRDELTESEQQRWSKIQSILFDNRKKRVRPLLDDKILCDWNGLMIAALAKAGAALNSEDLILSAEQAFGFVTDHLWDETSETLYHRYKDGERAVEAFADDFTSLIWASLELYEATFDTSYLKKAVQFSRQLIRVFMDSEHGGFFHHTDTGDLPFPSQKQIYDGAIPSANSVAMYNLIRLSRFTGDPDWEEKANETLRYFSNELQSAGSSITMGMMSVQFYTQKPTEIVVTEGAGADELLRFLRSTFLPGSVLLYKKSSDDELDEISPFSSALSSGNNKSLVYVCRDFSCQKPVHTVAELAEIFD